MGNHNLTHSVTYDGIEFKSRNSSMLEKEIKDYLRLKFKNKILKVKDEFNNKIRLKIRSV